MPRKPLTQRRDLLEMLTHKRPHKSKQEQAFIDKFIVPLGTVADKCGNLYVKVGKDNGICFASHLDTVHYNGGIQNITIDKDGIVKLASTSASNCLGGDDTAGVWLMREMILEKKPGMYVFHRGEEKGCIGSRFIADNHKGVFKDIKAVISLDRRNTCSVITFQRGYRCCSDDFGQSLADELGMGHKLDQGGSVTDSAQYTDFVGECTNLSVGFDGEHGKTESLDASYLTDLLDSLLWLDFSKLEFKRKPGTSESRWGNYNSTYSGGHGQHFESHRSNVVQPRTIDYYKTHFCHGYWDGGKSEWVHLTKTEWEKWRTGGKATTTVSRYLTPATDMERFFLDNFSPLCRLIESWGFDAGMLNDGMQVMLQDEAVRRVAKMNEERKAEVSSIVCPDCQRLPSFCQCAACFTCQKLPYACSCSVATRAEAFDKKDQERLGLPAPVDPVAQDNASERKTTTLAEHTGGEAPDPVG